MTHSDTIATCIYGAMKCARDFEPPPRGFFMHVAAMARDKFNELSFVLLLVYTILSLQRVQVRGQGIVCVGSSLHTRKLHRSMYVVNTENVLCNASYIQS